MDKILSLHGNIGLGFILDQSFNNLRKFIFPNCMNYSHKLSSHLTDKNTQLKELNGIIKNFKETTNDKYEVNIHITFTLESGILIMSRKRKPYIKLIKK